MHSVPKARLHGGLFRLFGANLSDPRFGGTPSIQGYSAMFAVIKTGGKQYKVAAGDKLVIEKLDGEAGSAVSFSDVLMISGEAGTTIGAPRVAGASVTGTLLETRKGDKVMVMKKTRRSTYRRRNGHRQWGSVVHITGISADGAAAAKSAKAAKAKAAAAE
jgi:large subunit ribosomal protein L21